MQIWKLISRDLRELRGIQGTRSAIKYAEKQRNPASRTFRPLISIRSQLILINLSYRNLAGWRDNAVTP